MPQSLGQYLLNDALPDDLTLDGAVTKGRLKGVMADYARKNPEKYVTAIQRVKEFGDEVATWEGISVGLDDIAPDYGRRDPIMKDALKRISATKNLDTKRKILYETQDKVEAITHQHPSDMTMMARSGGRGSVAQLMKTVASPVVSSGGDGQAAPWLITKSYSQGLDPASAWVAGSEARRNAYQSTGAVVEPGAASKVISNNMIDQVVTTTDCGTHNGIRLPIDSHDVIDRLLAKPAGKLEKDGVITPDVRENLRDAGIKHLIVRSAITCEAPKGVCQRCIGYDAWSKLPEIGTNVGLRSAQALAEPLTQFTLNAKHGVRFVEGKKTELQGLAGFKVLTEVPKSFTRRAAITKQDGHVGAVTPAAQGGWHISVGTAKYYSPPGLKPIVRAGDAVEAGDALTEGVPMPDEIVRYKGIGEGRRYLADSISDLYLRQGQRMDHRHAELLARSAINYVEVQDDPTGTFISGDIVPYESLKPSFEGRTKSVDVSKAGGQYLGKSALHYSVGTKITPTVRRELEAADVKDVDIAMRAPRFDPVMKSMIQTPLLSEDWMGRLAHRYLKKSLLEGAHYGQTSSASSTNPVTALAQGTSLGYGADGKYAEAAKDGAEKTASPMGIMRRVLLGKGRTGPTGAGMNKVTDAWGGFDYGAFDARKMQRWLDKNPNNKVKLFNDAGDFDAAAFERYRALSAAIPVTKNNTAYLNNLKPEALAAHQTRMQALPSAGVDGFGDAEFAHFLKERGRWVGDRGGRSVKELGFGQNPVRIIKERFDQGGLVGKGGVLTGDLAIDPDARRAFRRLQESGGKNRSAWVDLAMHGGQDAATKGLTYGLPAYGIHKAISEPGTNDQGERVGGELASLAGWGVGAPFGFVGGSVVAGGITEAGAKAGRFFDKKPAPQQMSPTQMHRPHTPSQQPMYAQRPPADTFPQQGPPPRHSYSGPSYY